MKNEPNPAEDPREEQQGRAQLAYLAAQLYAGKAEPPPDYSPLAHGVDAVKVGRVIGAPMGDRGFRVPRKIAAAKGSE
jgi:hypothetical protein